MLFNSLDFAVFLPLVFVLYWFVTHKNLKLQNFLIVIASYVFYGWWDWRFLSLIAFSTLVDYSIGVALSKEESELKRKTLLWTSISVNLGFLGFFKYFNFFLDNFKTAFTFFGSSLEVNSLEIILPVGISFYTFQTLSYTIDVYKRQLQPTKDLIAFTAFVSFFPQLVAGPIERASNLLPQFYKKRVFEYDKAVDGMRQILWGLFKKILIADNCAVHANEIFNNYEDYNGSTLILGAVFFTFQIYGDFSGYSDIAIGTSRLFGFNLKQNFAFPYFSRDIAEFWRRWHISLNTWFRDYLYIPLGGSRGGTLMKIRNTFVIFLVSGFWHGANWTFIVWGALNALYFLPILLRNKNRENLDTVAHDSIFPSFKELINMLTTFTMTVFAWIFFRAESIEHAFMYIYKIFNGLFVYFNYYKTYRVLYNVGFIWCFIFLIFILLEWKNRLELHAFFKLTKSKYINWLIYLYTLFQIWINIGSNKSDFIYFQF